MAKKKTIKTTPSSLEELKGDPANPREIDSRSAKGLQNSLAEFGDISGITFNRRTGELVTGHQRIEQIRERWGDLSIVSGDELDKGIIKTPDNHEFPIRYVDWSKARQRAANVAANSHLISGNYTDALNAYMIEVQPELTTETPSIMEDLLLAELCAVETHAQQTTSEVESMELGQHEESDSDIMTIKFAFADEEQHAYVTHAVELIKSMESFSGVAIDGQAIATICKRFILDNS